MVAFWKRYSTSARSAISVQDRQWQKALEVFRRAPTSSRSCSAAIVACSKARRWQRGLELFRGWKNPTNTFVTNATVGAAAAGQSWPLVLALLAEADVADVATYTIAARVCLQSQHWLHGLAVLRNMQHGRLQLDGISKLAFVQLLGAAGRWQEALWSLRDAPVEVYNACITICAKASEADAALTVAQEMRKEGMANAVTFGAALQACDSDSALQLLGEMQLAGYQPDAQAYTACIAACGPRAWQAAMLLLERATKAKRVDAMCLNAAAASCGRAAQWWQAVSLLRTRWWIRDEVTWNTAITACAEAGEWKMSLALLHQMLASDVRHVRAGVIAFNAALLACRNGSEWQFAVHVLGSMCSTLLQPDSSTATTVLAACERGGRPDVALDLWREFCEAHKIERIQSTPAYNAAIRAAYRASRWQLAVHFFHEMHTLQIESDSYSCLLAVYACENAGQWRLGAQILSAHGFSLHRASLEKTALRLEQQLTNELPGQHASPNPLLDTKVRVKTPMLLAGELLSVPLPTAIVPSLEPLQEVLGQVIPGATLCIYGSAAEGLRGHTADIDATILLPVDGQFGNLALSTEEKRQLQQRVLRRLRSYIAPAHGIRLVEFLANPRVPILKMELISCRTKLDLSVESRAGCKKSALVFEHVRSSPALRLACFWLKAWAKKSKVYGQYEGFPSGLAFTCMALYAAKHLHPPLARTILPTCTFPPSAFLGELELTPSLLRETLSLFIAIFEFYATAFDWQQETVTIVSQFRAFRIAHPILHVLDPVEPGVDLALPYLDSTRSQLLQHKILESHKLFSSDRGLSALHQISILELDE